MTQNDSLYQAYVRVLEAHLRPAMGCTEPIAIAYASAVAKRALGKAPERAEVLVSGNILKNTKAVVVPNTDGHKGVEAACAAGIIAGDPERELQVIADMTDEQRHQIEQTLKSDIIHVDIKPDARLFDIQVTLFAGEDNASARIADRHTNIVTVMNNGEPLIKEQLAEEETGENPDEALLTIEQIVDFAQSCRLDDVRALLKRQIDDNGAISREGIKGCWGACVGKLLLDSYGDDDVRIRARAYAAAGSDARMSGCEMPVIINSGSGNQGITVSVPLIEYARELNASEDQLLRALIVSNLTAIRLKALIACLSAYCGAISAGAAVGAGVRYLQGGDLYLINHTLVNALAILSGTICDGAKPSCAAKIACAVDAGLLGMQMAQQHRQFRGGEGIVSKGVEKTICNIGQLGRDGMKETDREILRIMLQ